MYQLHNFYDERYLPLIDATLNGVDSLFKFRFVKIMKSHVLIPLI